MNRIKNLLVLCALVLGSATLSAQNVNEMKINEILVTNENSIVDGFGNRHGWIELVNSSYGTVDIGGCYLSNDKQNLKKYLIPKGDVNTKIRPRQLGVFITSGNADHGTYYTNFEIKAGETIYFVSNDGRTIIDQVTIPADLGADQSYGRYNIEDEELIVLPPSPYSQNGDLAALTNSQKMAQTDPNGVIVTITSMGVVFVSLIVLFLIFKLIGKLSVKYMSGEKKENAVAKPAPAPAPVKKGSVNPEVAAAIAMALDKECGGEVNAAIAMALHMHMSSYVHDQESFVLTIQPKTTQWSNKADMQLRQPSK